MYTQTSVDTQDHVSFFAFASNASPPPNQLLWLVPRVFLFSEVTILKKKTRKRWDDGNDIRTFARDRDQNGARFIFLKVFHLACTHYGEITTMLARPPFSSDLLNFGTKTIQINNSPNTFICDTGERNIPGLIDILITL